MKSVSRGCVGSEMFTRRTATVTISAPDALTAAAFSARLLYFPVPTISRELKVRRATVHVSALKSCCAVNSSTSNKMHDLEIVAVLDADFAEGRTRHDFEVSLDGYPQRIESEAVHHLGHADSARHSTVLAVDPDSKAFIEAHSGCQ